MGNWWRRQQRLWSVERVQTSGSALTGSIVRHCNHQPVPAACSGSVGADSAVQQVDNSDPRSSRCVTEISSRQAHSQYLDNTVSRQYRYLRGPEIWILQPSMFEINMLKKARCDSYHVLGRFSFLRTYLRTAEPQTFSIFVCGEGLKVLPGFGYDARYHISNLPLSKLN